MTSIPQLSAPEFQRRTDEVMAELERRSVVWKAVTTEEVEHVQYRKTLCSVDRDIADAHAIIQRLSAELAQAREALEKARNVLTAHSTPGSVVNALVAEIDTALGTAKEEQ